MNKQLRFKSGIYFLAVIAIVVGLSIVSIDLWGGKPEETIKIDKPVINPEMTIGQFGQANALSNTVLKEIFSLEAKSDLEKRLDVYGSADEIEALVTKKLALVSEHASKNWVKIPIKFGLWFVFLSAIFFFLRNRKLTSGLRKGLLLAAVVIFGVVMGSDPGPMGTVKDAIHLFGTTGAIFPPRMIALLIFLVMVFLANKYICAWGCQAGTLQDLVFRINQTDKRKPIFGKQIRLPFVLTNTIRFAFFCAFILVAFLWGLDIIDPVDPFKIYKPMYLGLIGGGFVGLLLLTGLLIYRPWCHLLCPFGLAGWLVEKISMVKISVNYDTCIACEKCATACPSTVMGAILKRDKKTIPDCFACYTCRDVCPTDSISFSTKGRTLPPVDHFKNRKKTP